MISSFYNAVICENFGNINNLKIKKIQSKKLQNNEVRINVKACGINFPDKLMVEGKYQLKPILPFTPGMEVSGIITETNSSKFKEGTNIIAHMRYGGFSEEVIVNQEYLRMIPKNFTFEEAAGFSVAAQTAYVSLVERANIKPNQTLLILGATGGVGLAAIQLAVTIGAKVIAICSNKIKQNAAIKAGAKHAFNYREMINKVKEVTDNKGVDIIYDPIGGEYFTKSLKVIKWGGKILIVGFASGSIPTLPINIALIKGISILGVRAGEYFRKFPDKKEPALNNLFKIANTGKITPFIYESHSLSKVIEALKKIEQRKVIGRIILKP